MASEGGKAGKGPGKGAAPPPAGGGGKGGGKAEREEARKKKREEEAAALKQKQAAEKAHMAFLDEVPQRKPADIGAVTWSEATRQVMLPGGTTLVELSNGHMVCLRRTPQTAAEFVASRVSIALGMKAPAFRVVLPDTEEYKQIEDMDQRTVTFVDDMPMTYENFISELNDANEGDIPTEVKRPLVQRYEFSSPARSTRLLGCSEKGKLNVVVQEFLPGKSLDQWGGQLSEVQLTALGRLCALDALLNQDDQLAFPVWKESGKLTNIMAGGSPDMLVGIDQEVRPILDSNLEGYQARLRAMVSLLLDGSGDQEPITGYDISAKAAIVSNRELFQKSGFELDDANMAIFMDGVKAGFEHIASSWNSGVLQNAVLDAERAAAAGVAPYDGAFSAEQCAELVRSNAAVVASVGGLQTPIARETSSQQAGVDRLPRSRMESQEQILQQALELQTVEQKERQEAFERQAAAEKAKAEKLEREAAAEKARQEEFEKQAAAEKAKAEELAQLSAAEKARQEELEKQAAAEKARADELARQAAEEEAARRELERKVAEEKALQETLERKAKEQQERQEEFERQAAAEKARIEELARQAAADEANRKELERKAAEEKARLAELERKAAEAEAARLELERKAAEEKAKEEELARQAAAEKAKQEELEKQAAAERAKQAELERQAAEAKAKEEELARKAAAEKAKQEELEKQAAAEKAKQEELERQAAAEKAKHAEHERKAAEAKASVAGGTMDISDAALSGDGTVESVGVRTTGTFVCAECRMKYDTERALQVHWKFTHDPNRLMDD